MYEIFLRDNRKSHALYEKIYVSTISKNYQSYLIVYEIYDCLFFFLLCKKCQPLLFVAFERNVLWCGKIVRKQQNVANRSIVFKLFLFSLNVTIKKKKRNGKYFKMIHNFWNFACKRLDNNRHAHIICKLKTRYNLHKR